MIENYITETELEAVYPKVYGEYDQAEANFLAYINRGYARVLLDLHNREIDSTRLMPRLDLLMPTTYKSGDPTTHIVKTSDYTGEAFGGHKETRLVCYVSSNSETWEVKLQGSNQALPTDWVDVSGASLTMDTSATKSIVFQKRYKWYRIIVAGGTSITLSVYLVETTFDDLIVYASWCALFTDYVPGSTGELRYNDAKQMYDGLLQSTRFTYDDGDTIANSGDEMISPSIQFVTK